MKTSSLFFTYIAKRYLGVLLTILLVLAGLIVLFDFIELLRRAEDRDVGISILITMAFLKLPEAGQQMLPFAILFGTIFTVSKLNKTNELIVARAAGISVWQFLMPIMVIAFSIGVLKIVAINPLSSILLSKYDAVEKKHLSRNSEMVQLSNDGLWLKQDETKAGDKSLAKTILFARALDPQNFDLNDVSIFRIQNDKLSARLDAGKGTLEIGAWRFQDLTLHNFVDPPQDLPFFKLETTLTKNDITESFADPETISFWHLWSFAENLEKIGFPATKIKIFFFALLADPFLYLAMVFIAACVSLRPPRSGGQAGMVITGIVAGFCVFIADNFLQAWGLSLAIPAFVAGWGAPLITLIFGISLLLYKEETI